MSVVIEFQGKLEPIEIAGDFKEVINDMRLAASGGGGFAIAQRPDGKHVGIAIFNILTVTETDDEDSFFGS